MKYQQATWDKKMELFERLDKQLCFNVQEKTLQKFCGKLWNGNVYWRLCDKLFRRLKK